LVSSNWEAGWDEAGVEPGLQVWEEKGIIEGKSIEGNFVM
jgi:hypothetical protein